MGVVRRSSKTQSKRVMGIDASTNSLAFAVFENSKPVVYGKINFKGSTIEDRLLDARRKVPQLMLDYDVTYVCIESAVMVRSVDVAIKLAYFYGMIMAEFMYGGATVVKATPLAWQSFIGNKILSASQKTELRKKHPGKPASFISNMAREQRKQFTIDFFNDRFGLSIDDDDVGDALGVGFFASESLTRS